MKLLVLVFIALTIGALPMVGGVPPASATHDYVTPYPWPSHGWASQAHSFGHNGWGPNNWPTYDGGTATVAGYWRAGHQAGESTCVTDRYTNMNAAETASESSTTASQTCPTGRSAST